MFEINPIDPYDRLRINWRNIFKGDNAMKTNILGGHDYTKYSNLPNKFKYKKVIFHPPATIVLWNDGTKTSVKCGENDIFDCEKGLALCFMKKALGNTSGLLNKVLHKEIKEEVKSNDAE